MKNDRSVARRYESGFTLVELIAAVIVGTVLLSALTSFYLSEQRAFRQQQIQVETSQSLRVALEQIVRDLRAAGRNPLDAAGIGFTYADSKEVRFTLDGNDDGDANDDGESKGFKGETDGSISILTGVGSQPLASYADTSGTIFRYYTGDGTEITSLPASAADLKAIRRVDVVLTMTNRVPAGPAIRRKEAASVRLRNLS